MKLNFLTAKYAFKQGKDFKFNQSKELQDTILDVYSQAQTQPFPHFSHNPYALQPDTLKFLNQILEFQKPSTILEFGSGESTVIFSEYAFNNNAFIISVEHDRFWIDEVINKIDNKNSSFLKFFPFSLGISRSSFRLFFTYKVQNDIVDYLKKADLLLIDGPQNFPGRESAIYLALSYAKPGDIIIVDDFNSSAISYVLSKVPIELANCFNAVEISHNSHGLYVLKCYQSPSQIYRPPNITTLDVFRSYYYCMRDYYKSHKNQEF